MATITARRTEYKGIVYRSKSEAMFARWLELRLEEDSYMHESGRPFFAGAYGDGRGGFVYEPSMFGVTPDFLVWQVHCEGGLPSVHLEIIEYKPARPTATYCEEFYGRINSLVNKHVEQGYFATELQIADFHIYFGSVWNADRGYMVIVPDRGWHEVGGEGGDWLANYEESIRETRFDLQSDRSM